VSESETLRDRERDQYLAVLKGTGDRRRELDEREYLVIKGARDMGATWKQAAEALGMDSPQAACQRYDRLCKRFNPAPLPPCEVCGGACGIVCDREAQQQADDEFDERLAAALGRIKLRADSAGYVHVTRLDD